MPITVPAHLMQPTYLPRYVERVGTEALPTEVWFLVDGRVRACYTKEPPRLFPSRTAFAEQHPHGDIRSLDDQRDFEVPALLEDWCPCVDWAEVHAAAWALDQARRHGRPALDSYYGFSSWPFPGYNHVTDAFGGSYSYTAYSTLADLVRLVHGVERIAEDTWDMVHKAKDYDDGVARARYACRIAIACSRMFEIFHRAGLIDDPKNRICGTGPGYGLTGLRWLTGAHEDVPVSRDEVESFALGAPPPSNVQNEAAK